MSDLIRQLRILVPPFLFFLSLAIGIIKDGSFDLEATARTVRDYQGAIIAAIAGSSIPLGYLMSLFSINVTRWLFQHFITKRKSFEDPLTSALSEKLWSRYGAERVRHLDLPLHVIYSFHVIPEPVRGWIDRRWSTFVTSINFMGALVLAHLVGPLVGIGCSAAWLSFSLVLFVLGFWSARTAFYQVRGMFEALLETTDDGRRLGPERAEGSSEEHK